jgi:hypothetical protein
VEEKRLDTIQNPTMKQEEEKEQVKSEIARKDAPLVSFRKPVTIANDRNLALSWAEKGFDYLLKKDVDNAINAFTESENAYNQFQNVYEISKYLRDNRSKLADPGSEFWNTAYKKITDEYSYGMPASVKRRLQESLN